MTEQVVLKQIDSSLKDGLSESSIQNRNKKYGRNELDEEEGESLWDKIKE